MNVLNMPFLIRAQKAFGQRLAFLRLVQKNAYLSFVITVT